MAKGFKTGGRKAGVPNKATVEKERVVAENEKAAGRMLGKEVLATVMNEFLIAAQKIKKKGSPQHLDLLKQAADLAAKLAPYQSPQLQRTTLRSDQNAPIRHKVEVEFV